MSKLILLSGGFDSTVLARFQSPDLALFVDYGQPARIQERASARAVGRVLKIPVEEVAVTGLALGSMADAAGVSGPRVVQARNAILCSIGANVAASTGLEVVVIGATANDHADYADCRAEFFDKMSASSESTSGVRVEAPFVEMSKKEVSDLAKSLDAPVSSSWSCYSPEGLRPCGSCSSCLERNALS